MTIENDERITAAPRCCLGRYQSNEQCRQDSKNMKKIGISSSSSSSPHHRPTYRRRHHFTLYNNITTSLLIILVIIITQPRITTPFRQPYIIIGGSNNNLNKFRIKDSLRQSSSSSSITNGGNLGRSYIQHRYSNILLRQSKTKDDENENNTTPTKAAAATTIHETTTTTTTTTKAPIETYTGRELYDNGLSIVTDDDGSVTVVVDDSDTEVGEEIKEVKDDDDEEEPTAVSDDDDDNVNDATKTFAKNATNSKVASSDEVNDEITVDTKPTTSKSSSEVTTTSETPPKTIASQDETTTKKTHTPPPLREHTPPKLLSGFNVVLTHCNADFDSLASAVGLAKLWSTPHKQQSNSSNNSSSFDSTHPLPTFVVLPRGAHPGVQRFLSLHKHLFPIRSLSSLPSEKINRLGLVDAQKRDRIGPAEHLLGLANRVTVVDHHVEADSDIGECTDYVVDKVGSVSSLIVERLKMAEVEVTEAEATLLALGIHADTGSLCYDSTTPRDAKALAWVMEQGASQSAIAEHVHGKLSAEQKGVLTQALLNVNTTVVHGVTISTVLLSTDGFINGLAAVTQDALELSGSDVLILSVIYDAKTSSKRRKKSSPTPSRTRAVSSFFSHPKRSTGNSIMNADAWKGGEEALTRRRLRAAFQRRDVDGSGFLELDEVRDALNGGGVFATDETVNQIMTQIDLNHDGRISFDEFQTFVTLVQKEHQQNTLRPSTPTSSTMILIGRVKAGINLKQINLNKLFAAYGGGGHAKAASATVRLTSKEDESTEARTIMDNLIQELIDTSLVAPQLVGDFMTAPVLSARPDMTEKQVEDLFTRYDVRALPVVDEDNDVIGLVTYKEVAAAKERLWNKEQKRLRNEGKSGSGREVEGDEGNRRERRKLGSALKGWMKQHVRIVEASKTMAEVEALLLECDVGCIPVVAEGTKQLVGMVTRTDILRQHRYYPTLYYHNKGFSDSIAARKPIIELRKKLKKYDMLEEDSV